MRYIKFLVASVALVVAAACVNSEVDDRPIIPTGSNGELQIVGRVTQYTDCDVATRSKKEGDEPKVTSMGLALFPIENGVVGNCLYYDYKVGGSIVFIVDRHNDVFKNYDDKQFAMYIFANMQDADGFPTIGESNRETETDTDKVDGVGQSLEYFTTRAVAANVDVEDVPANGFPMMGSLGHTEGKVLILKPTKSDDNVDGLPEVNGTPTDNLEIPLRSMYAKFTFTIAVKPDQEIVGNKAPRFDLVEYSVNNIAATVDCDSDTNEDNAVIATSGDISMGNYAQGATTATFDFYLPERYLNPSTTIDNVLPAELKKGTYDVSVDADQNGYRDEDERYHQRFKNKLVDGKAATYVTINGKYTDHQGHAYDVNYNIYLGGNNYDNFDIIRNTHYNNSVTIRGISTSSDQATNTDGIAIDWRVNVERSTPLVINMRRESLLDAHFEVRPLRLRLVGENIPTGTNATVSILNEDGTTNNLPDWIRLETSGSNSNTYITSGVSAGKRKYFTTDLVTNTLAANTSITVNNLTANNQTLWIYVDENTDTKSRAAIVRISYDGVNTDFKIVQHGLFSVVGADSGNTYYIEQYEEYLYNYDAEDSYGQTKDEGMPWGLNKVQLSNEHNSFKIDEDNTDWNNYVASTTLLKYDFYIRKYDTFADNSVLHNYAGQHFTIDIFRKSNGGVKTLTMAEQPSGAVEYCYNRNKRNSDGSIAKVEWYLPSADELEDFIVPAYGSFEEFQDNYYWTSQPAYIRNAFYYEYREYSSSQNATDAYAFVAYEDNTEYARATKVKSLGNDQFDYALSGLNKTPETTHAMDDGCISQNAEVLEGSYFNVMYGWYRKGSGNTSTKTMTTDDHFNARKDGSSTGKRYHVHLGHLYDMTQDGYHHRTKSNRVRCARKDYNPDNEQPSVPVYIVSSTPATSLDTSGNTMYVMKNTNYDTYLTTSGSNVAASSSTVGIDNFVVIVSGKIKSVAKDTYFNGNNGNVSFNNTGTSYTINNNGGNVTISYSSWSTYYLKQTGDTSVSMGRNQNGDYTWYFYEVTIQ